MERISENPTKILSKFEEWRLLGCYAVLLLEEPNLAPSSSG
jgi:hypothetical protein